MKIRYSLLSTRQLEFYVSEQQLLGALISNNQGGYLFIKDTPTTRYQGVFALLQGRAYKIIDALVPYRAGRVEEMEVGRDRITRRRKQGLKEEFSFEGALLRYKLSRPARVIFELDISHPYERPLWGRHYEIEHNSEMIIVSYYYNSPHGKTDRVYVGIGGAEKIKVFDEWFLRDYPFDRARRSHPSHLYIYRGFEALGSDFKIAVAKSKRELNDLLHQRATKKDFFVKRPASSTRLNLTDTEALAAEAAASSLRHLFVNLEGNADQAGMYAGLPWFFQLWMRDEATALPVLADLLKPELLNDLIRRRWEGLRAGKFLPIYYNLSYEPADVASLDGTLLYWYRIGELLQNGRLSRLLKSQFKRRLTSWLEWYLQEFAGTKQRFVEFHQSWMDSLPERTGRLLEIEALTLRVIQLVHRASRDDHWRRVLDRRLKEVRSIFWDGAVLSDRAGDKTIRPNVFLSWYYFSELLTKKEWQVCFENVLPALWLEWGGLSTLDKNHPEFIGVHSGEPPHSYHRGDSWFFVNNIAALAMYDVNQRLFKTYIERIFKASGDDILSYGVAGHPSELSSASIFQPAGSPVQAWSASTYLELARAIRMPDKP